MYGSLATGELRDRWQAWRDGVARASQVAELFYGLQGLEDVSDIW